MLSERSESGLAGIRHNGVDYLVRKNVFGDITHLYAPDGGVAARYDYDAWGNPRIAVSGGHRVGELNPFLYRGYCYDRETGYYYLRTRYYDPEACRFLSPDDPSLLALTANHANGIMSYTYCADNPVMDVDDDGRLSWWKKLLLGLGFVIVGAVVTALTAGTGVGFLAAFGSALITSAKAVVISTAISAGIGFAMGGLTTGSWEGALNGLIDGAVDGLMWGGIFAEGGINLAKHIKVLSPNDLQHFEVGGTFIKIGNLTRAGKNVRLDVGVKSLLHLNIQLSRNYHIFIGKYLAGLIGGFTN